MLSPRAFARIITRVVTPSALAGALLFAAGSGATSAGCADPVARPPLKGQVHLTLLHTADIHSRLFPYNLELGQVDAGLGLGATGTIVNVGGAARVSYIVGRERARSGRVLHLDGGDSFQGAPVFNFYSGEAEIRALSAMGTDMMVVANHEFDAGATNLGIQLQKWATFPVLAANYVLEDPSLPGASPLGSIIVPFTTFDLEGLKVGVIGMANLSALTSIFNEPNRLGITPLNTNDTAQFYVDSIRPLVDVVVVVSHLGLDVDETMIANTEGIDVVLGGHNHIVLQPPKRVQDCSAYSETDVDGNVKNYILIGIPSSTVTQDNTPVKRYCHPRDVILSHSGAFAKFVGRLDLILSNDPSDIGDPNYNPANGFEVLTHDYTLFPVTEEIPQDPVVSSVLEPYAQGLDALTNLSLLVGYAPSGSDRTSPNGGDAPLGNMVATAAWLRLGIQTDFSLTNTTGVRADLVPGVVTLDEMYNIFPFDNTITTMDLAGVEVQALFDYVAQRSAGRGCVSQAQIAGARVVLNCTNTISPDGPGQATNIYIGAALDTNGKAIACQSDADCPGGGQNSCDPVVQICWQPIDPIGEYQLATSNYLAAGGSGFLTLKANTTRFNTQVEQRDAVVDYIRAGYPCGSDANGKLTPCHTDNDCAGVGDGIVCACPEIVLEPDATNATCHADPTKSCASGACVLAQCRDDVATFQRATCLDAPTAAVTASCEQEIAPCAAGGEQCKFLACVDRRLGNYSDNRVEMVGQ